MVEEQSGYNLSCNKYSLFPAISQNNNLLFLLVLLLFDLEAKGDIFVKQKLWKVKRWLFDFFWLFIVYRIIQKKGKREKEFPEERKKSREENIRKISYILIGKTLMPLFFLTHTHFLWIGYKNLI